MRRPSAQAWAAAARVTATKLELGKRLGSLDRGRAAQVSPLHDPLRRTVLGEQLAAVQRQRRLEGHARRLIVAGLACQPPAVERMVEAEQVDLTVGWDDQPVGVTFTAQQLEAAASCRRLDGPAQRGDRHVQVAAARLRVGIGPQRRLERLAVDRRSRVERQQAQQRPNPRAHGPQVDWDTSELQLEAAQQADRTAGTGAFPLPFATAWPFSCPFGCPLA